MAAPNGSFGGSIHTVWSRHLLLMIISLLLSTSQGDCPRDSKSQEALRATHQVVYYNLDMIISVGYRVHSFRNQHFL